VGNEEAPALTPNEATTFARKFIETAPLYSPHSFDCTNAGAKLPMAITMDCAECDAATTWKLATQNVNIVFGNGSAPHFLTYECVLCEDSKRTFWFRSTAGSGQNGTRITLTKFGENPSWSVRVSKPISKALGSEREKFFKKGLVCMSQGFGLGAVAYFRRVVEDIANDLLDLVEEAARLDGADDRLAKIAAARSSQRADEKLKQAASLIPTALFIGNQNPLSRLYDAYSAGIHRESEEDCQMLAMEFRLSLEYAIAGLKEQLDNAKRFRAQMAALDERAATRRKRAPTPSPAKTAETPPPASDALDTEAAVAPPAQLPDQSQS
jgi:hypothetical protein